MIGAEMRDFGTRGVGGIDSADERYFWDCLNEAARNFVRMTRCLTAETAITTVAGQQIYALPPDFVELHVKNDKRRLVARYDYDGRTVYPVCTTAEKLFICENETEERTYPARFAIVDGSESSVISGTATADGDVSAGEATLADSATDFTGAVSPGDSIANSTDGSTGVVLTVSTNSLMAGIFHGANDKFSEGDEYVIVSQHRRFIKLDGPSEADGHVLTVPYIRQPPPVYSDRGQFGFASESCRAVAYEAAYIYLADYDDTGADALHLHQYFEAEVRRKKIELARNILQGRPAGSYPYRI